MYSLVTGGQEPAEVVYPGCKSFLLIHLFLGVFDSLQNATHARIDLNCKGDIPLDHLIYLQTSKTRHKQNHMVAEKQTPPASSLTVFVLG